ncbi:mitochondrial 54S ribosomal protein rml2 [Basidiobolus ranarum]|uniref:Mitochondrial 54S ribosomal protein rml2 n=1 Tax=Basidiobolus ranarum TaxID=34480 RepID=A0ABR2WNX2_9FUNG
MPLFPTSLASLALKPALRTSFLARVCSPRIPSALAPTARLSMSNPLALFQQRGFAVVRKDGQFKTWKPITPGLRFKRMVLRDHLWKGRPIRKLTVAKRKKGGRNNTGRITVRHRGGGHKRRIRILDWQRTKPGAHEVVRLEYDPGRTAWIALLKNLKNEELSYIVAPDKVQPGDIVQSYRKPPTPDHGQHADITQTVSIERGNCMPLKMIPVGSLIHCIGLVPFGPGLMCRSAGTYGQLMATGQTGYAQVRLSSGEVRRIHVDCIATIGVVSNPNHQHQILGKAGARRWRGWRPTVRGMAMNPCDHPHGGGRGKSKGNRHPVSPWGKPAKGGKTRTKPNKYVIKPRERR